MPHRPFLRALDWHPSPAAAAIGLLIVLVVAVGCGGTPPPTPAGISGSPAPTASGVAAPSASGSPPAAAASNEPDPDAGAALEAFRAFIQTEQTFHMAADMQLTVGGDSLDMDVAADVAGADERGDIIIRATDVSVHMEIVVLDGVAWARIANRDWEVVPVDTTSSNPLLDLDADGLEPVGIVNVGGTRTHHFRVDDPAAIDTSVIASTTISDVTIDSLSFDVYVTDDGAPLAAIMVFAGSGLTEGIRQPIQARIRYVFSRFGEPVGIEAPV